MLGYRALHTYGLCKHLVFTFDHKIARVLNFRLELFLLSNWSNLPGFFRQLCSFAADIVSKLIRCRASRRPSACLSNLFFKSSRLPQFLSDLFDIWLEFWSQSYAIFSVEVMFLVHYCDVTMNTIVSQITGVSILYSVCSGAVLKYVYKIASYYQYESLVLCHFHSQVYQYLWYWKWLVWQHHFLWLLQFLEI